MELGCNLDLGNGSIKWTWEMTHKNGNIFLSWETFSTIFRA